MNGSGKTVLVVDDEPSVLRLTRTILERAGYVVLTATSGREALAICLERDGVIDLLVTDVCMPEMDGVELAHCIQKHNAEIPVIMMTGFDPDLQSLLKLHPGFGSHTLVRKPFRADEFARRVGQVISSTA